jgi:hypothetical protein
MISCQGTTQPENRTDTFRYRSPHWPRHEPIRARACPPCKRAIAAVSLDFAASPLAPQPHRLYGSFPMAVRDHASLVTHRNCNLASTIVINSSQRRTCATMLALTSHYMATNAKHPRHAPGLFSWLATQRNRQGVTGCEKRFAAHWGLRWVCVRFGFGLGLRGADAMKPGFHDVPWGSGRGEDTRGLARVRWVACTG